MNRVTAREIAVQIIFAANASGYPYLDVADDILNEERFTSLRDDCELYNAFPDDKQLDYIKRVVTAVSDNIDTIDSYIDKFGRGWSIKRISAPSLSVLRCAIAEILYLDDVPDASAINAAVDIIKNYDEPEAASFVNGILGSVFKSVKAES